MCHSWTDQRVELYLQNRLPAEQNAKFERHLLGCKACQERIEDEVNSLLALRRAAQTQRMLLAFA